MRARCSPSGISSARSIAEAMPPVSYGLTRSASTRSSAAPASSLSTSAPVSSIRLATYSFATRFIPSRSGVTSITSAAA